MFRIVKFIFCIIVISSIASTSTAQTLQQKTHWKNIRRNSAAVIFSSIGGAVLGLSTLSFYGQPQEHTENITVGAVLGLIGGIVYVSNLNSMADDEYRVFPTEAWALRPTMFQMTKNRLFVDKNMIPGIVFMKYF